MSRVIEVVFARSGCAVILGTLGGLIGLVSWAVQRAQSDYPRSPSCIIWAAVGSTFGFVLGACMGKRRLTGRPAWLVSGLVAGMLLGALIGWIWAHAEYGRARAHLLQAGLAAKFIDAAEGGLSVRGYEAIGLQYGICLGILVGTTAGWFWNHPPRLSSVANLFPVLTSCFVALGVIAMHTGIRELSKDVIEQVRRSWVDLQSQKLPEASRSRPETGTH
jgi:F0F1-type ATP synthase assembly protein I